jgi:hypothetical protein
MYLANNHTVSYHEAQLEMAFAIIFLFILAVKYLSAIVASSSKNKL